MSMMRRARGFTLIELMIAVAIVGILAAIAYPSYLDSVRKSRRADAQGALLGFANGMERHFTETSNYCNAGGAGGANTCGDADATNDTGTAPTSIYAPPSATAAYYTFTINNADTSTYTLRVTPVTGSSQARDGMFEIDETGARRWDRNNDGDFADANENNWNN
jgi:type IV pilus assembly protein PilE